MKKKKKKSLKVKRKVVKLKKKKTTKKTTKKKIKKVVKKKTVKKRKKRKKVFMEDIYSIINKVQLKKKKITFATDLIEAPVIENNIRNVELKYKKIEMKTQVVFTLFPDDTEYKDEEDILLLEILDDEIPAIGQIFG